MAHINPDTGPDPYEAYSLLQEEAAEVIKELNKIRRSGKNFIRNGGDKTNWQLAQEEIWDFLIVLKLTDFTEVIPPEYLEYKYNRLKEWTNLMPVVLPGKAAKL